MAAVFLLVAAIVAATVPWPSGSKAPAPGVLVLESTPPGGEVTIEGRTRGETPVKLELAPGRYEVTVSGHGRSRRLAVEIESGKAVVRRVDLGPERAAVATGSLEIVSQPSGARVLVDGRVRGQTPLLVDELAAGRHVVLVESGSGAVRRTVRVRPGETTRVELSIYSGFLRVTAPLELEVFADGRGIGFAGRDPLLLPPGRHTVELVNELLGYRSTHVVDVAPGEEERLVVRPLGTLNVNALPWAEVWVDGERLGETPIANAPVPLGTREVVFRHPQYGERRVTVTVKAGAPAQATVDFTR
ncbi:MAG TPA: PEGA domain-containing protein [Vicinamibacterales bacterium]|nr:PEGA domain-containing protein [Vicinamibacterales bacterium]